MQKFGAAGIVVEYNPFHKGHEWMMQQLRALGYETIVCVMSGPLVQRAEPAFLPTHVRAAAAIAGGASLVLRLPAPYATASAEGFAAAGAGLLAALGCVDVLAFGAESTDTERHCNLARLLQTEAFGQQLKKELGTGASFAAARAKAAETLLPGAAEWLRSPNNILGVEYCKALLANEPVLPGMPRPLALPRLGAAHDGTPAEGVASASWLRELAKREGMEALEPWVPKACLPLYVKAAEAGECIEESRWETAVLARLRGLPVQAFAGSTGGADGLAERMAAAVQKATTLQELYSLAKSKRFAHSRVRRLALAASMGFPAGLPPVPPYLQVLAANSSGVALLKKAKQRAGLPVSTSLAKLAKAGPQAKSLVQMEALAEDLYALCQKAPGPGGGAYTRPAHFEIG